MFERIQALEEKRAQFIKDQKRIAKLKKGGPQQRKQAQEEEIQMKKEELKRKKKKSLDEELKDIHESYQVLLNEYNVRKAYRDKNVATETNDEGDQGSLM